MGLIFIKVLNQDGGIVFQQGGKSKISKYDTGCSWITPLPTSHWIMIYLWLTAALRINWCR